MADEFGEKTEPPTPRRRLEARERGQVAKSQDLPAAVVLLAGMIGLELLGPSVWRSLFVVMRAGLSVEGPVRPGELAGFSGLAARTAFGALAPFLLLIFLSAFVVTFWQVGFLLSLKSVTPSLNKLNPLSGLKRMFSPRTLVATLLNFGKVLLLVAVVYWTLKDGLHRIIFAMDLDHVELYVMAAALLLRLGIRLAIVMLILALFDLAYQRYRHEKELKMSKEEVKEEMKRMEGDPLMKRRRREAQMKLALQRIQSSVPRADVVVTNPTHLAIALKYDPEEMVAPRVVAKGADWMAFRIRQIAATYGVPIVERKGLVRMMYDVVEVGREIPERFYEAVAEILAYVYELTGRNLRPRPVPV